MNSMTPRGPVTMSSREIAELVEKRHDNVKRTIETLVERGVIVRPQIEDEQDTDAKGRIRTTQVYRVGKRDSHVIVAQLSPEFTARLVDRWQELEEQVRGQRPITADDLIANPMQLLQIAQGYALKIEDMKREITVLQEDAEALERISGSDDLIGIRVSAKMLDMAERKFTDMIQHHKFAYRHVGSRHLLCYADKHKAGMCKNVGESFTKADGSEGFRETLKFYPKGLVALAKKLNKDLTEGDIRAFLGKPRDGELPL